MIYDYRGERKYLTSEERSAFIEAAMAAPADYSTFALTLALTGARISELLATTPGRVDFSTQGIMFQTLKRRRKDVFRVVPMPTELLDKLDGVHDLRIKQGDPSIRDQRIWTWCRTTAWSHIKTIMHSAGIAGLRATPRGLRHGFGVQGTSQALVPLNMMQKWLGHARIETTAIYANALGPEERSLAARIWGGALSAR